MTVKGYSIHPGSAKDKMKNSQTIAMEFDRLLRQRSVPSTPRAMRASTT